MKINEIIPIVAAIIGLTPVILKWLNDRSTEAARRRTVQQAKEQVEFWQTWLQAQREVSTDERFAELQRKVSLRLDELILKTPDSEKEDESAEKTEQGPSFFQKLFLAFFPHTVQGWIFHTFYYITVSGTLMYLLGASISTDKPDAAPSWNHFVSNLGEIITVFLIFAAIAFGLQRLAIRSERRYLQRLKKSKQ